MVLALLAHAEPLIAEGQVARVSSNNCDFSLITGGLPMTAGRHYWEVEFSSPTGSMVMIGAVRPGLDHDESYWAGAFVDSAGILTTPETNSCYFINGCFGSLHGNGMSGDLRVGTGPPAGKLESGDRIGVLLDLDAGWMRFFRNGLLYGPGFTEGVTGPLVRAAELGYFAGDQLTAVPTAVQVLRPVPACPTLQQQLLVQPPRQYQQQHMLQTSEQSAFQPPAPCPCSAASTSSPIVLTLSTPSHPAQTNMHVQSSSSGCATAGLTPPAHKQPAHSAGYAGEKMKVKRWSPDEHQR